jgi:hypothetical protein
MADIEESEVQQEEKACEQASSSNAKPKRASRKVKEVDTNPDEIKPKAKAKSKAKAKAKAKAKSEDAEDEAKSENEVQEPKPKTKGRIKKSDSEASSENSSKKFIKLTSEDLKLIYDKIDKLSTEVQELKKISSEKSASPSVQLFAKGQVAKFSTKELEEGDDYLDSDDESDSRSP